MRVVCQILHTSNHCKRNLNALWKNTAALNIQISQHASESYCCGYHHCERCHHKLVSIRLESIFFYSFNFNFLIRICTFFESKVICQATLLKPFSKDHVRLVSEIAQKQYQLIIRWHCLISGD